MKIDALFKKNIWIFGDSFLRLFIWGISIEFLLLLIFYGPFHSILTEFIDILGLIFMGIMAGIFAFLGSLWVLFFRHTSGWNRRLLIVGVMVLTVVGASPIAGFLWALHDIQSWQRLPYSDLPDPSLRIIEGIEMGMLMGPVLALVAVPINVCGLFAGYFLLDKVARDLMESLASPKTDFYVEGKKVS